MGKLLIGHYGSPPEAESVTITLRDCHQRLGMKPSDFVSTEPPSFFKKAHGALGRYLVFLADVDEIRDAAVWRVGYYLLPLEAADVLKAFNKQEMRRAGAEVRPFVVDSKLEPPADVMERARLWVVQSQPLLFHCKCPELLLKMDAPTLIRRQWRARLGCKKRCQPALKTPL